jgi:cytidylate kinase
VRQVVTQAAEAGQCVIVGRGAPYFLRNRSDTFSAFLYAPRRLKIERVQAQVTSRAEAENLVDSVDQGRAAFIKHYFGKDWPNRHLYHLMVNTLIGVEACTELLLQTMESVGQSQATSLDLDWAAHGSNAYQPAANCPIDCYA